jgi:hypothetical protein
LSKKNPRGVNFDHIVKKVKKWNNQKNEKPMQIVLLCYLVDKINAQLTLLKEYIILGLFDRGIQAL